MKQRQCCCQLAKKNSHNVHVTHFDLVDDQEIISPGKNAVQTCGFHHMCNTFYFNYGNTIDKAVKEGYL